LARTESMATSRILEELRAGDRQATDRLLSAVYDELRSSPREDGHERPGQTLQATALVLRRICGSWAGNRVLGEQRALFAAAAEAMRRILWKRHGERPAETRRCVPQVRARRSDVIVMPDSTDLVALDEAWRRSPAWTGKSRSCETPLFAGLTVEQQDVSWRVTGHGRSLLDVRPNLLYNEIRGGREHSRIRHVVRRLRLGAHCRGMDRGGGHSCRRRIADCDCRFLSALRLIAIGNRPSTIRGRSSDMRVKVATTRPEILGG